jgi:hypothetical protein
MMGWRLPLMGLSALFSAVSEWRPTRDLGWLVPLVAVIPALWVGWDGLASDRVIGWPTLVFSGLVAAVLRRRAPTDSVTTWVPVLAGASLLALGWSGVDLYVRGATAELLPAALARGVAVLLVTVITRYARGVFSAIGHLVGLLMTVWFWGVLSSLIGAFGGSVMGMVGIRIPELWERLFESGLDVAFWVAVLGGVWILAEACAEEQSETGEAVDLGVLVQVISRRMLGRGR